MERTITVLTDLKDLGELLSGASVDEATFAPASGQLALVLRLTRAMLERQEVVQRGPFRRLKTPWTKCELRLSHLSGVTVTRHEETGADIAPVLAGESVTGGYQLTVQAPDGVRLALRADQLDGHFADVGHPMEAP